jgi:hypothetical protein
LPGSRRRAGRVGLPFERGAHTHNPDGLSAARILFCDQNRRLPQIRSFLADTEPAYEAELLAFLEKLVRERLMLSIDGRYLSLAVRAPDTPVHELPERRSAGQATFLVHQD